MQTYSDAQTALQPVPEGFSPEGIQEAQIAQIFDQNTCYLLSALPTAQYRAIFAHILKYATLDPRSTMQLGLFEVLGEYGHEAIILYNSVEDLAKLPDSPAGVDTYGKAIILYESLFLCKRRFHRDYTELRLPLGQRDILVKGLCQQLRAAHKTYSNKKVQQVLRKMAGILQSGEFLASIPRPTADPQAELKSVLLQLLKEHGIDKSNVRQTSLAEACTILAEAAKSGQVFRQSGEFPALPTPAGGTEEGDSQPEEGEFPLASKRPSPSGATGKNASEGEFLTTESPFWEQKGAKRRHWSVKKGNLDAIFGPESPEIVPSGQVFGKKGDSVARLSISVIPSSQISLENGDTLNDTEPSEETESPYEDSRPHWEITEEVTEYRNRFDQGAVQGWTGSLYKCVRNTRPEIRFLAEIATVYYQRFGIPGSKKEMFSPGGFFTKTCERYRAKGAVIPPEIKVWQESGLALEEIRRQIQQENKRHPAQMTLSEATPVPQEASFPEMDEYELPLPTRVPAQGRGWMRKDEAEQLCARIVQEGQRFNIQAQVFPGKQAGTYVVETTWDEVEARHITPDHWARYFEQTSAFYED